MGTSVSLRLSSSTRNGIEPLRYLDLPENTLVLPSHGKPFTGLARRIALALSRLDLVILDELGYLPFSQAGLSEFSCVRLIEPSPIL